MSIYFIELMRLKNGDNYIISCRRGWVGQIFCQWAKAIGCTVIGTVGSDEKIAIAKKNGAHHVINYSTEDFSKKVLEITNGKGVDAVYDGVGIKTFEGSLACIKLRGTFLSFGNASGAITTIDPKKHLAPKGYIFYKTLSSSLHSYKRRVRAFCQNGV